MIVVLLMPRTVWSEKNFNQYKNSVRTVYALRYEKLVFYKTERLRKLVFGNRFISTGKDALSFSETVLVMRSVTI